MGVACQSLHLSGAWPRLRVWHSWASGSAQECELLFYPAPLLLHRPPRGRDAPQLVGVAVRPECRDGGVAPSHPWKAADAGHHGRQAGRRVHKDQLVMAVPHHRLCAAAAPCACWHGNSRVPKKGDTTAPRPACSCCCCCGGGSSCVAGDVVQLQAVHQLHRPALRLGHQVNLCVELQRTQKRTATAACVRAPQVWSRRIATPCGPLRK